MKKLVAYSSVSHLAFCVLGMFALTREGLTGSVLYMLNHGLSTGALFLVVGMIYERYHTRDMNLVGGIVRRAPALGFFCVFFVFSSVALPGLNGFVSEFLVLLGTFVSGRANSAGLAFGGNLGPAFAVPAALGVILGAVLFALLGRPRRFRPAERTASRPLPQPGRNLPTLGTQDSRLTHRLRPLRPRMDRPRPPRRTRDLHGRRPRPSDRLHSNRPWPRSPPPSRPTPSNSPATPWAGPRPKSPHPWPPNPNEVSPWNLPSVF